MLDIGCKSLREAHKSWDLDAISICGDAQLDIRSHE